MTPRQQGAMGECERRTEEARIAALFARPRTHYRAVQCVLLSGTSSFSSLLASPDASDGLSGLLGGRAQPSRWEQRPLQRIDLRATRGTAEIAFRTLCPSERECRPAAEARVSRLHCGNIVHQKGDRTASHRSRISAPARVPSRGRHDYLPDHSPTLVLRQV